MMRKLLLSIVAISAIEYAAHGQQDFLMSQVFMNPSLSNPGLTALQDDWEAGLYYRYQWLSNSSSPYTQAFSLSGTINKPKALKSAAGRIMLNRSTNYQGQKSIFHAVALNVINDNVGAFGRFDLQLHWSPNIRLSKKMYLGVGPTIQLSRFQINQNKIDFLSGSDQAWDYLQATGTSNQAILINFNAFLYRPKSFIGVTLSDPFLAQWVDDSRSGITVDKGIWLVAGKRFQLSSDWDIQTALASRYTAHAPLEIDGNVRLIYKDGFWLGASTRNFDAICVTPGFKVNKVKFGYTLERSTLKISNIMGWTHEFYLGLLF